MKQLYCDMDGVLVDFWGGAETLLGTNIEYHQWIHGKQAVWDEIIKYGQYNFWSGLNKTPWCDFLWDNIKQYNPIMLTNPSRDPDNVVKSAKCNWVYRELGNIQVICERDKKIYSNPDSMLIDDKHENRVKWRTKGGIALKVYDWQSAENSIHLIEEFMNENTDS